MTSKQIHSGSLEKLLAGSITSYTGFNSQFSFWVFDDNEHIKPFQLHHEEILTAVSITKREIIPVDKSKAFSVMISGFSATAYVSSSAPQHPFTALDGKQVNSFLVIIRSKFKLQKYYIFHSYLQQLLITTWILFGTAVMKAHLMERHVQLLVQILCK